jgi:pimeloyl-ACP methyl ester carboxylesterase
MDIFAPAGDGRKLMNSFNLGIDLEHHLVRTNGVKLHVVQAGPEAGPLLILLHGYPEFWYGWRKQIPSLAAAGFRVWAPDQRGYNMSEKPRGVGAYKIDELAADVIGLIDAAGRQKAYLAGHDWGAVVAWRVAQTYPERLDRMVILNVPHPAVIARSLRSNPRQLRKSLYIFFFQIPWLPELFIGLNNWRAGVQTLLGSSRSDAFTQADLQRYREAWSQPGAMTSMINWYRAALQDWALQEEEPNIDVPTLVIWGVHDKFLGRELALPSVDLCKLGRLVFIETATHWVHLEESQQVNELIIDLAAGAG